MYDIWKSQNYKKDVGNFRVWCKFDVILEWGEEKGWLETVTLEK